MSSHIIAGPKRLAAEDLSCRQPEQDQGGDRRIGMHGTSNSATYYRNREDAERLLAAQAVSDNIRQIHLTLAERYRELSDQSNMQQSQPR